MFKVFTAILLAIWIGAAAGQDDPSSADHHDHVLSEMEVGSVYFANSCANGVQTNIQRAVALLHSFEYEQTRAAFIEIAKQDPHCAIAYWGVAMSHYHGLWNNSDMGAGRQAIHLAQLTAVQNSVTTARERAYIDALAEVFKEDAQDGSAHALAFEQKMAALQASYPDDSEAAIFHALTLDIAAPKTDKTFANQRKCGEILEPIFARQPNHPGVAHYLIHCYDNPVLAEKGLDAARKYAAIAPVSAHANHMPSHIFTRVGSWQESIQSNLLSAEVAKKNEIHATNAEARENRLHAMDYLEYAYLQSGRVKEARSVVEELSLLPPFPWSYTLSGDYARAAIPARYVLELSKWDQAARLEPVEGVPWAQAIRWLAIGIGAARSNDLSRAGEAERKLADLRDTAAAKSVYWSNQIEVQHREVSAWIAQRSGNPEEAVAKMRSATELEESMDKDPITPGPIIPAREMLAQLLQIQGRPQLSLKEYEEVLKSAPNRFNALWGAASSADSAGETSAAAAYLHKVMEVGRAGERPELEIARARAAAVTR